MDRIPEHRTCKMMLREMELFSLVKKWLRGDITQIFNYLGSNYKTWNLSNGNIMKIHCHKL